MPLSPILPKWVNSVSSQTDGSVFPSIGGSILVSVKVKPVSKKLEDISICPDAREMKWWSALWECHKFDLFRLNIHERLGMAADRITDGRD